MIRAPLILPLLALAACAGGRDACVADARRDLVALDAEIRAAATGAALGYRLEAPRGVTVGTRICSGGRVSVCTGQTVAPAPRVIPLDPRREAARRARLEAARPEVARAAASRIAACGG